MAPCRRDPSDRLVPGRARGGEADDRARARRQDHQCRLAGERGRPSHHCALYRGQGRHQDADPSDGGRMGGARHPGQRHRARLYRYRNDEAADGRPQVRFVGQGPHAVRPMGQARGSHRRCGVPRLACLGLCERASHLCRWRAACRDIGASMTAASPTLSKSGGAPLAEWLRDATPAFLFALRLWASVFFTYYVTFALQLSDPTWAVTTAAIVCTPVLGASLRKAFFRMIGTVLGAIGIVILAAFFRQDRISFLVGLALWCAASAFIATLLRNFAAYAAALSGYTAAILASDVLGPVGTNGGDVTFLAINRAIEICVGILCAGVVLAVTDLGHSRRRLAAELASLSTAIMDGFADCFLTASSDLTQFQGLRRDLLRRVIALDPTIDAAIGEASDLRYRSPVLQRAVSGLVETMSAWRKAAYEIALNRNPATEREAHAIYNELPRDRLSPDASASAKTPAELRAACCSAVRSLTRFNAETPSQRLLADSAAQGMLGMARGLNGLVGVVDPPDMIPIRGTARLHVPDWLPPSINAVRAFLAIGVISLFWIASAWPNGALAITFCAIIVVLLPLQGDVAYSASMTFLKGCVLGSGVAAVLVFAILPRATTFPSLCLALGLALLPLGFMLARAKSPLFFFAASVNFLPMLSINNTITFDASQFWNTASSILAGIAVGAVAMRILPPLSPAIRADRKST